MKILWKYHEEKNESLLHCMYPMRNFCVAFRQWVGILWYFSIPCCTIWLIILKIPFAWRRKCLYNVIFFHRWYEFTMKLNGPNNILNCTLLCSYWKLRVGDCLHKYKFWSYHSCGHIILFNFIILFALYLFLVNG